MFCWKHVNQVVFINLLCIVPICILGLPFLGFSESVISTGDITLKDRRIDDLVVLDGKVVLDNCVVNGRIY